jgi:hypothetical protein
MPFILAQQSGFSQYTLSTQQSGWHPARGVSTGCTTASLLASSPSDALNLAADLLRTDWSL